MSAFYDLASLVLVPSGYKASKVYAQKPLTTDGQLTFSRASTATRVNSAGLIETVASNVPRLDYAPTLGQSGVSCPRLLLEPQRTQLLYDSTPRNFSTSATANRWVVGTGIPAVVNQAVGIFGTNTATRYTKTAGQTASDFLYYNRAPVVSGSTYTVSGYIKLGTATNAVIVINNTTAWNTVPGANFVATAANGYSDWKRFSITFTAPVSTQVNVHIGFHDEPGVEAQATGTFFIEGLQLELGSYATSLIPSFGAAVTRGADAASKTGISSLLGTEGTWFVELDPYSVGTSTSAFKKILGIFKTNGSVADAVYIEEYLGNWGVWVRKGNSTITSTGYTAQPTKVAVTFGASGSRIYFDGIEKAITATDTSNDMTQISTTATAGGGIESVLNLKQMVYIPSILTPAQLAELTTL